MECMRRNARGRRPPRFEGASICLSGLSPSPVGRHALIGYPQVFRGGAGLIEYIDGDPSARIPVAADEEPLRLLALRQQTADREGATRAAGVWSGCRDKTQRKGLSFDQQQEQE